jgi:hypothetical protein
LIGEVVLKYRAYAEKYYARDGVPTGEHVTITCALRPLVSRYAALPVNEFKPDKLELVQEDMIKLGRSRSYINKSCNIIRRCFKWCVKKGFVTGETFVALQAVDGLKRGRSEASVLEVRAGELMKRHDDAWIDLCGPCTDRFVAWLRAGQEGPQNGLGATMGGLAVESTVGL